MHMDSVREFLCKCNDPTRIYRLNYWTYVFTGFWEYESGKKWQKYLYKTYRSVLMLAYVFSVFSYFSDAVSVRYDLDKLSFNMSSNGLLLITLMKVSFLRMQISNVKKLLRDLDNNLNIRTIGQSIYDREIFKKSAKIILNISRTLYTLLIVSFTLRILIDTVFGTRNYLIPLPFKDDSDDYYEIIYAQQVIVGLHFLVTVIAHDLLIYGIINRFIAHFEILEKNFLMISRFYPKINFVKYVEGFVDGCEQETEDSDVVLRKSSLTKAVEINKMHNSFKQEEGSETTEKKTRRILKENIYHHQKLLKEILNFTRIYSSPFIIQASAAVFITGVVGLKIILLSSQVTPLLIHQVMYVGINLANNLFLCSLGSELSSKSVATANALYQVPWYEMGMENRRIISFALKKLLEEPKLKGGGLVIINRRTYLKFLQISYNMVVLLRNLYKY